MGKGPQYRTIPDITIKDLVKKITIDINAPTIMHTGPTRAAGVEIVQVLREVIQKIERTGNLNIKNENHYHTISNRNLGRNIANNGVGQTLKNGIFKEMKTGISNMKAKALLPLE